jgi:catechol 2,3-dioxygenase-like lactoylglutathione lyase family enzyme
MTGFGLTFHHLGLAVRNPATARSFLEGLGYRLGPTVFDPEQNVNLIMCEHPKEPWIEIIYPAAGEGPLAGLIEQHANGIVYHACYVSENLRQSLASLKDAKLQPVCIWPPRPAVLFGGAMVSFYNVLGMGLIEIIDGPVPSVR